jgi:hypothetical protein
MKYTLVYTAYRRPEFTKRTTESILQCRDLNGVDLFIGLDGPLDESQKEMYDILHHFYEEFVQRSKAGSMLHPSSERKGCAVNVVESIEQACGLFGPDFVIHLENDVLVSQDYFQFMRYWLEKLHDEHRVWSVDGCCEEDKVYDDQQVAVEAGFRSTGWGMPIYNWREFYYYWLENGFYPRKTWSWDFVMDDCRILHEGVRVYPKNSRIKHIGWYGTNAMKTVHEEKTCPHDAPNWKADHNVSGYVFERESSIAAGVAIVRGQKVRGPDRVFDPGHRCM